MTLKMKVTVVLLILVVMLAGFALASAAWLTLPDMAFGLESINITALSEPGGGLLGECESGAICTGT